MELRLYLRMLQRSWWMVLLTGLAALSVALLSLYMATPLYRATARFIVVPNASLTESRDVVDSLATLDRRSVVSTYAEVLESQRVYNDVVASMQAQPDNLATYTRAAVVLPDAFVVELSASGPDPEVAAVLANNIGQQAIAYSKSINQVFDLVFLDPATPPAVPYSPQPLQEASLALGLGLVVGGLLAFGREQLRTPLDALRRRLIVDSASSAYTRRYFTTRLDEELARVQPGGVSLGLVRLNSLPDLLETLPAPVMQRLLNHITQTLGNELRGNDTIGRWDDVTFSVLLPATPAQAALRTMDRILQALSAPVALEHQDTTVNLFPHAGAAYSVKGETSRQLSDRAVTALEQARQDPAHAVLISGPSAAA